MRARPWLILSIGLNLFLAAGLYVATRPLFDEAVASYSPAADLGAYVRTNVIVRHENFTWGQVENTNYAAFVKNLRDIGCPEQTIRDIVTSEISRVFARRKLSEVVYPNFQWWRSEPDALRPSGTTCSPPFWGRAGTPNPGKPLPPAAASR